MTRHPDSMKKLLDALKLATGFIKRLEESPYYLDWSLSAETDDPGPPNIELEVVAYTHAGMMFCAEIFNRPAKHGADIEREIGYLKIYAEYPDAKLVPGWDSTSPKDVAE